MLGVRVRVRVRVGIINFLKFLILILNLDVLLN